MAKATIAEAWGNQLMKVVTCSQGHQNPDGARFCSRCGLPLPEFNAKAGVTELQPKTRLRDRYIILNKIGQGGFGRTYLAQDTGRFKEQVVIKEFTPAVQGISNLQKAEELFEREAEMLHKLKHPQIPRFGELFRDGKQLYLVQELIEGKTYQALLNERLEQGKCFSEAEINVFLRQLLPVLVYLHHQGIIHRDIAPDNIVCREQDHLPILIDLGGVKQIAINIAQEIASSQKQFSAEISTRLGKFGYAPDEQMRLGIVAPYSDLYALGVTAIVLMTGKQPQQLLDPHSMNWNWEKYLPNLNPQLKSILYRMVAHKPYERFQSAEEILEIIEPASGYSPAETALANNSGEGALLNNSILVPDEIKGWNWGAFLLPGVWCLTNRVWIGLVAWVDPTLILSWGMPWLTMGIILGFKGNEWAWKSRRWRSIAEFKRHQRGWAIAAWLLMLILLVILIVTLVIIWFFLQQIWP